MPRRARRQDFSFEISLSVLNHLGRNLYRNFITVLGEAISNAWDADAKNVWIDIDRDKSVFSIKDDGIGMNATDFQTKFLRIGYSKRADGSMASRKKRPFIGAKGIGKLALLSCAQRVSVFTKKSGQDYVGGVIDNTGLDQAIKHDLTPDKYSLESLNFDLVEDLAKSHRRGTIIVFEETKEQIKNSIAHIKKMLALSFRFSLIDEDFSLHVNGERVTMNDLKDLISSTEFVWLINNYEDEFVSALDELKHPEVTLTATLNIRGFIGTVKKPRNLKITGTEERATIDLFVNGRLRERNILRHIPTQRIIESYIYGQIHFDSMDRLGKDPFTSSREGVVEDDQDYQALLKYLKHEALPQILDEWDEFRLDRGEEGDEENSRMSRKSRKARDLYAAAREEYEPEEGAPSKDRVDSWLSELRNDAEFNISSYVDCFLSENLVRKFMADKAITLPVGVKDAVAEWREREEKTLAEANISFKIRQNDDDLSYLGMDQLAVSVEGNKNRGKQQTLWDDAISYRPVRNVIGHTGLLTKVGKTHLTLRYENIKARVKKLVSEDDK